jgi:hypothetical protein
LSTPPYAGQGNGRGRFEAFEAKVDRRFEAIDRRFEALEGKVDRTFVWLAGIQVTTFIAIVVVVLGVALGG